MLAPDLLTGSLIAARQPADVIAVWPRRPGSAVEISAGPVQDHHLVDEHRQRPPVDHDVVGGDHQTPLRAGQFDEQEANRRRAFEIKRPSTFRGLQRLDVLGCGG